MIKYYKIETQQKKSVMKTHVTKVMVKSHLLWKKCIVGVGV